MAGLHYLNNTHGPWCIIERVHSSFAMFQGIFSSLHSTVIFYIINFGWFFSFQGWYLCKGLIYISLCTVFLFQTDSCSHILNHDTENGLSANFLVLLLQYWIELKVKMLGREFGKCFASLNIKDKLVNYGQICGWQRDNYVMAVHRGS